MEKSNIGYNAYNESLYHMIIIIIKMMKWPIIKIKTLIILLLLYLAYYK